MRVVASSVVFFGALGRTAPSPEPNEPVRTHEAPASELSSDEQAEAREWIGRYQRGETSMSTDDPTVTFVATGSAPCQPMPSTRPPSFEVVYWADPHEDMVEIYYGVVGRAPGVCHFEWDMLWVDPPAGACAVLDDAELDALYAELRELEVWTIETRAMEPVPHSVGVGLLLRWPGSRCAVIDVHGVSEVVAQDSDAFRAALDAFRAAYNASLASSN